MTREASSDKAKALAAMNGVQLVKWDTNDSAGLFKEKVGGMFLVQNAFIEDEAGQGGSSSADLDRILTFGHKGIELVNLAETHGVQHLVYSSVDFCGQDHTPLHQYAPGVFFYNHC